MTVTQLQPREASRVDAIIQCEQQADAHLAEAEALRWQAAELIAAELADGKTQRQLAADIGKSHPHVSYMASVWRRFGNLGYQERPSFNQAYQQAKLAEADADEERRRAAVSYQTAIYSPVAILAQLAGGQETGTQVAAHMRDYPHYTSATPDQFLAAARFLAEIGEAS